MNTTPSFKEDPMPGWREQVLPKASDLQADDPRTIGEFSLVGRIGQGRQAVVYLGVNAEGGTAAVKVLKSERRSGERALDAFEQEARALRLAPDSVSPRFYGTGWNLGFPYLASEYLHGPSLQELIQRNGPLAGPELARFAVSMSEVVVTLHERGIQHGDVKPRHVIIVPGGRLLLVDFGIAEFRNGCLRRRDVFNLAAVILYAAGGSFPYEGTPLEISSRTMAGEANVDVLPRPWRPTFRQCLNPNFRRHPSARQVLKLVSGERERTRVWR